jgi:hypothetical protein
MPSPIYQFQKLIGSRTKDGRSEILIQWSDTEKSWELEENVLSYKEKSNLKEKIRQHNNN